MVKRKKIRNKIKEKKLKDSINPLWILLIILIMVLIFGGINDWFNFEINIDNKIDNIQDVEDALNTNIADSTCTLDLSKNNICLGDPVTGVLEDGDNTKCYIFSETPTGWEAVYEGKTNSNGVWSEVHNINAIGTYQLRGLCDKDDDSAFSPTIDCITNQEQLIITDCSTPSPTENGESVGGADGNGVPISFDDGLYEHIDLGDLPPTGEGDCKLQALINTEWSYANQDECFGIQGNEAMWFTFSDSTGRVWERTDANPTGLGSATKCGLVWDGVTDFLFTAEPVLKLQGCEILLDYDIDIVTCECGE